MDNIKGRARVLGLKLIRYKTQRVLFRNAGETLGTVLGQANPSAMGNPEFVSGDFPPDKTPWCSQPQKDEGIIR